MADEHVFFAHRCGYAIAYGKQLANDWSFQCEAANRLAQWLLDSGNSDFWAHYTSDTQSPWVVLHDRDFHKTWTTESGFIFSNPDYVDGDRLKSGIFRVKFLDEPRSDLRMQHIVSYRVRPALKWIINHATTQHEKELAAHAACALEAIDEVKDK